MVFTLLGSTLIVVASAQSPSPVDYQVLAKIREEGLVRSQVMDHIGTLSDVYGARLTGSPAMRHASDWAMKKFTEWGLTNVRREEWSFGKGWSLVRFSAHLTEPSVQPLIGYPKAWSAGTAGSVLGKSSESTSTPKTTSPGTPASWRAGWSCFSRHGPCRCSRAPSCFE